MKNVNLFFGILLFFGFLATGLYLKMVFKPEHLSDLAARMEIRANHIYILFISLLNILSVDAYPEARTKLVRFMNLFSRVLLPAAGLLAVAAFFLEHSGTLTGRLFTF